jgi:hypothetical protein
MCLYGRRTQNNAEECQKCLMYYYRKIILEMKLYSIIIISVVIILNMFLNEAYSRVQTDKHLSDMFPITKSLKKRRCFITTAFQL